MIILRAGPEEVECEQCQVREQTRANYLELTRASLGPGSSRANGAGAPRRSPGTRRRPPLVWRSGLDPDLVWRSGEASRRSIGKPSLTHHLPTTQTDLGDSPRLATEHSKLVVEKYAAEIWLVCIVFRPSTYLRSNLLEIRSSQICLLPHQQKINCLTKPCSRWKL